MSVQRAQRLVTVSTPDGIVFRRIWSTGEDAWRLAPDGKWSHCAGHKGPWVGTNKIYVPREILRALAELQEICAPAPQSNPEGA